MAMFSVEQLKEDGFTGPVPILSKEKVTNVRRRFFEAIGQPEDCPGPTDKQPGGYNLRYRWAHELAVDENILDHVERALGPDIVLWAAVFWYKEPHNTKYIPWHQDASYWPMEPRINLTAWVALGPTSPENGCLRLIPGSHKHWLDDQYQTLDEQSAFAQGLNPDQVDESKAVDMIMEPGDVVFFSEAALHGSNANVSDIPRLGFSIRFTIPEVKFDVKELKSQGIDYLAKTVLVRGDDNFHYNESLVYKPPE